MKLLVVDDDKVLVAALRRGLEAEGYTVDVAHDGLDGTWMATESAYRLIVLDVLLPGRNGFDVCRTLRGRGVAAPILMLTAKDGDLDQAEALDIGADDYLVKPFSYAVLLARIRALLRRAATPAPEVLAVGDLTLAVAGHAVARAGDPIELTTRQFQVLEHLVRHAGEIVSKEGLLDAVWSHDFAGDPNIVEVYVARLRRQIDEPFGRHSLQTVRGAGYRLVDDRGTP